MSIRSYVSALVYAGAVIIPSHHACAQIDCWAPGMSTPVTLTETDRTVAATLGKPFRCDVFGVAGSIELGNKASNATVTNGSFRAKTLVGNGPLVKSTAYVMLQTGLTNLYPEKLSVTGSSPGDFVGPVYQYGDNWTLSDPKHPATVQYTFHMVGSSPLGLLAPAYYNLNPKGYFYALGEYHEAPPVLTGTIGVSSNSVLLGSSVNVSYQIARYDAPIYRPPFLGLDLANANLTVLGTPPQTPSNSSPGPARVIATGQAGDRQVTIQSNQQAGSGWKKISNVPS